MTDWPTALRATAAHKPVAMVSVLATEGSAPRGAGTRMLATADALHGTIGGGQLEYRAVEQARSNRRGRSWRCNRAPGACRTIRSARCSASAAEGACGCWSNTLIGPRSVG